MAMDSPARDVQQPDKQSGGWLSGVRGIDARLIDVAIAVVLTVLALTTVAGRTNASADFRNDDVLGAVLVASQTLPLVLRRVLPFGVFLVINAAVIAHSAIGYEVVQAGTFGSLIAFYGAASMTDTRRGIIAGIIGALSMAGFFATNRGEWDVADIATTSGTWAIAWLAGTFIRLRGEQAEAAGARVASLEIERDARAREAVADERARMARELHDIVGHALNVIVIQAAGARRVFDTRPEVSREALASIESAGREALSDMERMLGVLRATEAGETAGGPQPGLGDLPGLAAHVAEAGIPVEVDIEGERHDIPASVDLSAFRIVQEALTNSLKHSGASRASVKVRYEPDEVEVEVVDNGRGATAQRPERSIGGRGHLGMRERVSLFGGEISVGPVTGGGYRVQARLPFKSVSP